MMRNPRLLLYIALLLAVANFIAREDAAPALPLIHADYQRCISIDEGPIASEKPKSQFRRKKDNA